MKVEILEADLTRMEVDAIVNAANSHLQHGGGVAGAIVRAGGEIIQTESDAIGYVPTGSAAVTGAGTLPCRYVIHAVGPMMGEGDEDRKLEGATRSSLARAEELELASIAFPAISTGIFGYPVDRCARIMLRVVRDFEARFLQRVVFCLRGYEAHRTFMRTWEELRDGR